MSDGEEGDELPEIGYEEGSGSMIDSEVSNAYEETDPTIINKLKELSKEGDAFLSIIMPYYGQKVTPSKIKVAELGLDEEFGVESAIKKIKEYNPDCKNLYLLINSHGGLVASSYKIAKALRANFENINVFVPHVAQSGGTLIALIGNKIVMGMMSQLSPLDPHVNGISSVIISRSFKGLFKKFKRVSVDDMPYPLVALVDQHNPIELEYATWHISLMEDYVHEILTLSGYDDKKAWDIAVNLVEYCYLHEEVINFEKAKKLDLNVYESKDFPEYWDLFRKWLSLYGFERATVHKIRFWINSGSGQIKMDGGD